MTADAGLTRDAYERAARYAPARFASGLTGNVFNGYWIDRRRYFFCAGAAGADGTIGCPPSIADAERGAVEPVLPIDRIATLLSGNGTPLSPADLVGADYDMPDASTLVVTLADQAYHVALAGSPALIRTETLDTAPALHSPDGRHSAFLKDDAVWIRDRATGLVRQLSPTGERYYAYGRPPESGIAPLAARRSRMVDGLWSADSRWFATSRIDERHLPVSGLIEHVPAEDRRSQIHAFKAASPDADLPTAEIAVFEVASGRMIAAVDHPVLVLALSPFANRHAWFAGNHLYFLDWGRYSSEVALIALDLTSGETRTVLREKTNEDWIDVHPLVAGQPIIRTLPASGELIWYSQADGFAHLFLHDLATGALKNRITQGAWTVRELVHVDEEQRRLLFLASGFEEDADLGRRHLCAIGFDGSGFERIALGNGDINALPDPVSAVDQSRPFRPSYARGGVAPDGRHIVVQTGSADTATRTVLAGIASPTRIELARSNADALWTSPLPQPFEVLAADGATRLFGTLHFPADFDPARSYPLADYIYPGPQMNWFSRRLATTHALILQSVVEFGFVGLMLETRGMPNRSRAFHQAGKGSLHEPQLSDHVAAIEQLCRRHSFLDRDRIGIFGQSGGGFASARAMFDYPERFKVAVSVCGNHDSRHYISHWIDKYGPPPDSPGRDGQANASVAHELRGKLLLIHGDMDDNVHPAHTLALSAALIAAGKDFDQLIVPNAGHGVLPASPYVVQRLWTYFIRHLLHAEPPADFVLHWTPAEHGAAMALLNDRCRS